MKRIFIFALFFTIITNINIAYSISPDVFIQSTVNRASQILSENISREELIFPLLFGTGVVAHNTRLVNKAKNRCDKR